MANNKGILDPVGKNKNPLTDQPYSDQYKALAKVWSNFPAYERANEVINNIKKYQVILIAAETGSGKTVLVPKYVLHALDYKGKVAVTLPKQIIAQSAAEFSAKTLDVELGKEVGYKYRGSPREGLSTDTKLLYATDGTIVAKLLKDPKLSEFDAVVIDEAHERKVQIDFLMYLLRETVRQRPEFKVIIMSATINSEIFESYFAEEKFLSMMISGRTNYPIESIFQDEDLKFEQTLRKGFDVIKDIVKSDKLDDKKAHDILFFVTSSNEAIKLCKQINNWMNTPEGKGSGIYCIEVYAGMDSHKQYIAQDRDEFKKGGHKRKLVIATNVAESSLTIDGIKFVIDSGYELSGWYDPKMRAKRLDRMLISEAQARQRMGRAGRTEPGVCYHMYTKNTMENKMKKFPEPDIRVNDISSECLRLLAIPEIKSVEKLLEILTQFIEPPREEYIMAAITILIKLGAVENGEITKLGLMMGEIGGNDLATSHALLMGRLYDCSYELAAIFGLTEAGRNNMGSIFVSPRTIVGGKYADNPGKRRAMIEAITKKFNVARSKFKHKYGDHLSLLNLMDRFNEVYIKHRHDEPNKINEWCIDHFVKINTLKKARRYAKKIKNYARKINKENIPIEIDTKIRDMNMADRVLFCLQSGFIDNRAYKKDDKFYRTTYVKDMNINLDKMSFLTLNKTLPKNGVYTELFVTRGRATINIVSKIME